MIQQKVQQINQKITSKEPSETSKRNSVIIQDKNLNFSQKERATNLMNVMYKKIQNQNAKICDLENETNSLNSFLKKQNNVIECLNNKLEIFDNQNHEDDSIINEILRKIGEDISDDYKKES